MPIAPQQGWAPLEGEHLSPALDDLMEFPPSDCFTRVWEREGGTKIHLTKGGTA
jgi:hypothetical protein